MAEYSHGLAGFESGVNMMAKRQQLQLRMQELQSEAALRRLHEQQIAQAIELKMQENQLQNQFRAEMATALQTVNDVTSDQIMVPMQGQEGIGDMAPPLMPVDNPNPMRRIDAMTKFVLPVIGKYAPEKAGPFVNDLLMNEVRMQQEQRLQEAQPLSPLGKLQSDRTAALKRGDTSAVAEFDSLINAEQTYTPSTGEVTTPSGRKIEYFKSSPRSAQVVAEPSLETLTDPETGAQRQVLRTGASGAKIVPQDIGQRQLDMSLHKIALEHPDLASDVPGKPGMKTISPDRWDELALRKGVTSAVQTTAQKNIMDAQKTVSSLVDLEKTLRPTDVGVKGVIGDEILDTWLPQFGFKTADIERMDNRTKLKALIEGALREVSVDNRFSNQDRADIKEVLPRSGMRESYERSIRTIQVLTKIFSKRAMIDAATIGKPTPPWAALALDKASLSEAAASGLVDDDALLDAVRMGKITNDEAIQLRQSRPKG